MNTLMTIVLILLLVGLSVYSTVQLVLSGEPDTDAHYCERYEDEAREECYCEYFNECGLIGHAP